MSETKTTTRKPRTPKRRNGHTIDDAGLIHYDEVDITWAEADALAGRRLDRRKSYMVIQGQLCEAASWTQRCSGCAPESPYGDRGHGCHECGYHGVVRTGMWVPIDAATVPA